MDPRPIRFFHRGAIASVADVPITRSVLDWLRTDARCTGTKEGCNEGDCGACTVIVAELAELADHPQPGEVGGLRLRTVNACLQFLPTLDGKALLTVEDLAPIARAALASPQAPASEAADGTSHSQAGWLHSEAVVLHPAQRALVECHGSQCGFCTPGFAMSLAACYEQHAQAGTRPTRAQLADALSGNLCRCTGYRPILDAGERMFALPSARLDTAPIVAALRQLHEDAPLHYAAPNPAQLDAQGRPRTDRFHAPRSLEELAAARAQRPGATLLAGSTDIGLWSTKQFRDLPEIVYLGRVEALRRIERDEAVLRIGAAAPLEDAWRALMDFAPGFETLWRRFASPPVRHAGTMGGNVANGSPIGDSAPALMALDATLLLRLGERERRVPLSEFYLGYMANRLDAGEFVAAIEVPRPTAGTQLRGYKLSKRFDCDISAVCAGFALALDETGAVRHARFAFGGLAATVSRAAAAEAAALGRPWNEATVRAAMQALATDYRPLDDLRASAAYRLRAAQNLLQRLWLETRAENPLAPAETTVWAGA